MFSYRGEAVSRLLFILWPKGQNMRAVFPEREGGAVEGDSPASVTERGSQDQRRFQNALKFFLATFSFKKK